MHFLNQWEVSAYSDSWFVIVPSSIVSLVGVVHTIEMVGRAIRTAKCILEAETVTSKV